MGEENCGEVVRYSLLLKSTKVSYVVNFIFLKYLKILSLKIICDCKFQ